VLQRVESADSRQGSITVTDCQNFGDSQSPQTLAYALENARDITIQCSGTLVVPEIVIVRDVTISAVSGLVLEGQGLNRVLRVLPGISLELSGVDITGGRFNLGSALFNAGNTSITDADITDNRGDTATIMNAGVLDLQQVNQFRNSILFDSVLRNTGVLTGASVAIESHVATGGPVLTNRGDIEFRQCSINGLGTNNVYSVNNEQGSTLKLFDCTISNSGSLFRNEGTLEIFDSSIDANRGDQTLIESSGVLKIGGTAVTNNEVSGLVIYNEGLAELINSTISTNRAGFSVFGNAANEEDFRGVIANEGLMQIKSSTIANNIHPGFTDRQIGNAGELQMTNSIVVGTGNGEACGGAAAILSQGHNLHTDGSCGAAVQTDIPFGDAALLPLANNGGLGRTHALSPSSDAIDTGNCNSGSLSKDQRGVSRPQGGGCDIGAFELVQSTESESGSGVDAGNGEETGSGGDTGSGGESGTGDGSATGGESGTGEDTGTGGETGSGGESGSSDGSGAGGDVGSEGNSGGGNAESEAGGESTENDTGDPGSNNDTEDDTESSTTDTDADTTNDDTIDTTAVEDTGGGGGAMLGMNALLLVQLFVVCRRRVKALPGGER